MRHRPYTYTVQDPLLGEQTIEIDRAYEGGPIPPGLIVIPLADPTAPGCWWAVTHERSGLGLLATPDPESAIAAAADPELAAHDWTRTGAEIRNDPEARAAVHAIETRLPHRYTYSTPAPANDPRLNR